jgi:hypothetical protein
MKYHYYGLREERRLFFPPDCVFQGGMIGRKIMGVEGLLSEEKYISPFLREGAHPLSVWRCIFDIYIRRREEKKGVVVVSGGGDKAVLWSSRHANLEGLSARQGPVITALSVKLALL